MDLSGYLDSVRDNAGQFVAAVRAAGVDAPVPTCPDWTVADLARHQGRVFRWVSEMIETKAQEMVDRGAIDERAKSEDPLTWLESGAEQALAVLGSADPDIPVWNWFDNGPGPARFWFRRLAHEVAIHRVDAEAAAGKLDQSAVGPAELAADGIDEFLAFLPLRARGGRPSPLSGTYHFHTTDTEGEWVVDFGENGTEVEVRREHAKSDVAVRGAASDLELFLYNRRGRDGLAVFGDEAAVAAWSQHIRF